MFIWNFKANPGMNPIGGNMQKNLINGIDLAFDRRGKGIPLVLIHGYPLDHSIWLQVASLLENDFDLIMPDLPGFGESSSHSTNSLLPDMAEDFASLLDYLKIKKAFVVGHSMGGYLALAFARGFSERLLGLGLVASQALADSPEKKAARYQEAEHILSQGVGDVAADMSIKLTENPILQSQLKNLMLRQHPQGLADALKAMAERQDSMQLLKELSIPVVTVHGLADKLIPPDRARAVQNVVKEGYLTEIEGAGHMPMMEAPQVTAEALKKFTK
jgi:3-oxoadipate enol-lactonase